MKLKYVAALIIGLVLCGFAANAAMIESIMVDTDAQLMSVEITAPPFTEIAIMVLKPSIEPADISWGAGSLDAYAIFADTQVTDVSGKCHVGMTLPDQAGYYLFRTASAINSHEKQMYIGTVEAMNDAVDEILNAPVGQIKDLLETHRELLNLNCEQYDVLLASGKNLSLVYNTLAQAGSATTQLTQLQQLFETASIAATIDNSADKTVVDDILKTHLDKFLANDSNHYDAYNSVADEVAYKLSRQSGLQSLEAFCDFLEDSIALAKVNAVVNSTMLNEVISNFATDLNLVDTSVYDGFGVKKELVFKEFVKHIPFSSLNSAASMFNTAVTSVSTSTGTPSTGSSGGGGGGGGGTSSYSYDNAEQEPLATQEPEAVDEATFSDIAEYEWAKQAIYQLYNTGIVSGKGNRIFDGLANVKREEFVKMACLAFDLEKTGDNPGFTDVSPTDWFYEYVAAVKKAGIVNGISSTEFGTSLDITREDMAVILCNFLKKSGFSIEGIAEFDDFSLISEYAMESVAFLAKEGIVNGVGGNMFAPKQPASRAAAAKIIYESMNYVKGKEGTN